MKSISHFCCVLLLFFAIDDCSGNWFRKKPKVSLKPLSRDEIQTDFRIFYKGNKQRRWEKFIEFGLRKPEEAKFQIVGERNKFKKMKKAKLLTDADKPHFDKMSRILKEDDVNHRLTDYYYYVTERNLGEVVYQRKFNKVKEKCRDFLQVCSSLGSNENIANRIVSDIEEIKKM